MRKIVVAILAVILVSWRMAFAFQNEPKGFRDLRWGNAPKEGMQFVTKQDQWLSIYKTVDDKLSLGDVRFYQILYQFYTPSYSRRVKRFITVGLYFAKEVNFDTLETICKTKFGEPTREGFYEIIWIGDLASVALKYDLLEEKGFLGLSSRPIFQEYTQEKEKKQVEEAEKDW